MGKKRKLKREKNAESQNNINVNIFLDKELHEDERLVQAIVRAHELIELRQKEKKQMQDDDTKKAWLEALGQKEYSKDKCVLKNWWNSFANDFRLIWKVIFFKKENANEMRTTLSLISLALVGIFGVCKMGLYIVALLLLLFAISKGVLGIGYAVMALGVWLFARAFRIAMFEVAKIKDANMLIAVFSGCISFVAVLISIVSLLVSL